MMRIARAATLLLLYNFAAHASDKPPTQPEQIHTLETVSASTTASGPPMWEFTRGSKRIVVLGTMTYLPEGLSFDTAGIERHVAQSQVVVSSPGLVVGDNIGLFRGLTLWPGIRRNKFNDDNRTLSDVLPADVYREWEKARQAYSHTRTGGERLRPMYAAMELFEAVAKDAKLAPGTPSARIVADAASSHGIPTIDARFRLAIADPKAAVKQFHVSSADDVQCLKQTIDRLVTFVQESRNLGEAWSSGDQMRLEEWRAQDRPSLSCWSALTNQAIARQEGFTDLQGQIHQSWNARLQQALEANDTIFTSLPLRELLDANGLSSSLRRAGFTMTPVQ